MTPAEQALARQRARQRREEQARIGRILDAYSMVQQRLDHDLDLLTDQIQQAQDQGVEVRPGWLFAQARYRSLLGDLTERTHDFLQVAAAITREGQKTAVTDAVQDGRELARLALRGPKSVVATVTARWDRLPAPAFEHLIGRAGDGTPLAHLFAEIAPLAPTEVRDALAFGVAAGRHPSVIARDVRKVANITPNRALTIARTEVIRSHREAVTKTWQQTGAVAGWVWRSARDTRTCPVCWALDGTEHEISEGMQSHPCCRCARIPRMRTWAEMGLLGLPERQPVTSTGPDVFARLSEADKLAILGRARLNAYNAGQITLADLVQPTHSDRWGPGVRLRALREALA